MNPNAELVLTCDSVNNLSRTAVWLGGDLCDLYIDLLDKPNLVGAIVAGKVSRSLPSRKAVYADAGLDVSLYAENADLKVGFLALFRIVAPARQGKAYKAVCIDGDVSGMGIVSPPPTTLERALADIKARGQKPVSLLIQDRAAHHAATKDERFAAFLAPLPKEPVHPDLSERMDALCSPRVSLADGTELVIETTEALVAIDVNEATEANPLGVNLRAAVEIARQIRLRALGGAIIVDFLKMKARTDANKLLIAFRKVVAEDPASVSVFGLTKLGLMEATRLRRGPSLAEIWEKA